MLHNIVRVERLFRTLRHCTKLIYSSDRNVWLDYLTKLNINCVYISVVLYNCLFFTHNSQKKNNRMSELI